MGVFNISLSMKWDILIIYIMIKRKKLNKIVATVCIVATLFVMASLVYLEIQKHPSTEDAAWFSIGLGVIGAPMICVFLEIYGSDR